jgi:hypothetical protein
MQSFLTVLAGDERIIMSAEFGNTTKEVIEVYFSAFSWKDKGN